MHLEDSIKPGSYVLVAKSGEINARDILLVTDASLVLKTAGRKALIYFCDVRSGAPIEGARIKIWEKYYSESAYHWRTQEAVTGTDGLAKVEFTGTEQSNELLVTGVKKRIALHSVPGTTIITTITINPGKFTRLQIGLRIVPVIRCNGKSLRVF